MRRTYHISIASVQQYCSHTLQFRRSGGKRLHFSKLIIRAIPLSIRKTVTLPLAAFPEPVGGSTATSTGQTTTQFPHPVHLSSSSFTPVSVVDCKGVVSSLIVFRFFSNPGSDKGGQSSAVTSPRASLVAKAMHVLGAHCLQFVFGNRLYRSMGFSFKIKELRHIFL
jgi:hypothetical protein